MLKTLNWYVAKTFLLTFLMAMGVLTFGMTGARLIKVFNYISNGVSADVAFSFMFYVLPVATAFTIPWAALVAIMLVFGRLSADNEITAMRACGVSILQIVSPIILICFLLTCACLYLQLELGPRWLGKAKTVVKHVVVDQPLAIFEPGVPVEFDEYRILIDRKDTVTRPVSVRILESGDKAADFVIQERAKKKKGTPPENGIWTVASETEFTLPKGRFNMEELGEGEFFTTALELDRIGEPGVTSGLHFVFIGQKNQADMSVVRQKGSSMLLLKLTEGSKDIFSGCFEESLLPATLSFSVSRDGKYYICVAAKNGAISDKPQGGKKMADDVRLFDGTFDDIFVHDSVVKYSVLLESKERNVPTTFDADVFTASVSVMQSLGRIHGVQFLRADRQKLQQDVTAAHGRIVTDTETKIMHIILENATIMAYEKPTDLQPRRTFSREISFDIEYGKEFNSENVKKRDKHEGFRQLYARSIIARDAGDRLRITEIETELNQRVALALAPIAFLLLGLPLAIRTSRRETSIGLFISVILAVGYFMAVLVSDTFSSTPNAYPQYMVWIPPAVYEIIGSIFLVKITRN